MQLEVRIQIFGSRVRIGSNCWKQLSHRLRSQYQPAILSSAPSQSIALRHRPNFTPSYNNSQNYWSAYRKLCTYYLFANGKKNGSDFIEQIPLCIYKNFKAMCNKSTIQNQINGRPSYGHYCKNFPNKLKIQCGYNSNCAIPQP